MSRTEKVGAVLVVLGGIGLFVSVGFEMTPVMVTVREFFGDSLSPGMISIAALIAGILMLS